MVVEPSHLPPAASPWGSAQGGMYAEQMYSGTLCQHEHKPCFPTLCAAHALDKVSLWWIFFCCRIG